MKRKMVPIYEMEVWFSNDEADAREFLKKHDGDEKVCDDSEGFSHQWSDKSDKGWRLMCVFDGRVSTVAHEATHMAWDLLEDLEIKETPDSNHEALCFLVGWFVGEFVRSFPEQENKPKAPAPIKREDAA